MNLVKNILQKGEVVLRRYIWIIALIIVVVIGGIWYSLNNTNQDHQFADNQQEQPQIGVVVGKVAPIFTLDSLDAKKAQVGGAGNTYVLNFWASWCPPCRAELPELAQFASKYSRSVQFYAINLQESEEKATGFLKQGGYNLPILFDKDGTVAQTFRVTAIPTTIVIDSKGIIRYRKSGGVTLGELETVIKGL